MNNNNFSKIIKELRLKNNLTQKEFADKLGVTYQAVSKWENDKNLPDITILKDISKIFKVNIDYLLTGEDNKPNKTINKVLIISIITIMILALILTFNAIKSNNSFEFKTISSNCEEFSLTGSAAYNKEKTSIYIANIDYCGEEDVIYNIFDCNIYEEYKDTITKIGSCGTTNKTMSLNNFLNTVRINVNDYKASCKMFKNSSLYLEIKAQNNNSKIITYKVPLKLEENCK